MSFIKGAICGILLSVIGVMAATESPSHQIPGSCKPGIYEFELVTYSAGAAGRAELTQVWLDKGRQPPENGLTLYGFTEVLTTPVQIHVPAVQLPDDPSTFRTWGHELLHVVCGVWHEADARFSY